MLRNNNVSNLAFKIGETNSLFDFMSSSFATKMRGTVTKNKQDSAGRRLGLKKFDGQEVFKNDILIRQRGFKYKPGENVHYGRDHTLVASKEGIVKFTTVPWSNLKKVVVNVLEKENPNRYISAPIPFMYHPSLYPEEAKNNYKGEKLEVKNPEKYIKPNKLSRNREEFLAKKESYLLGVSNVNGTKANKNDSEISTKKSLIEELANNSYTNLEKHRKKAHEHDLSSLIKDHLNKNYEVFIENKESDAKNIKKIENDSDKSEVNANSVNNENNSLKIDQSNKISNKKAIGNEEDSKILGNMNKSLISTYLSMKSILFKMYLNSDEKAEEFNKKLNIFSSKKFYELRKTMLDKFQYILNYDEVDKFLFKTNIKQLESIIHEIKLIINGIKIVLMHKENKELFIENLFNFDRGISKRYNTLRDMNNHKIIRINEDYDFKKSIHRLKNYLLFKYGFVLDDSFKFNRELKILKLLLTKMKSRLNFKYYNLKRLRKNINYLRRKRNIGILKIVNMHKLIKRKDLTIIKDLKPMKSRVNKNGISKITLEKKRLRKSIIKKKMLRKKQNKKLSAIKKEKMKMIQKKQEERLKNKQEKLVNENNTDKPSNEAKVSENKENKIEKGVKDLNKNIKKLTNAKKKSLGKNDSKNVKLKETKKPDSSKLQKEKSRSKSKTNDKGNDKNKEFKSENTQVNIETNSLNNSKNIKI